MRWEVLTQRQGFATLKSTIHGNVLILLHHYNLNKGLEALELRWPFRGVSKRKQKKSQIGN